MASGTRTVDKYAIVPAIVNKVATSLSPKLVSLKGYNHVTAVITVVNTTGVTGSAITLAQSQAVAGTNSKALGFDTVFTSTDIANSVAVTAATVASNTFTTTNTANAIAMYCIEVDAAKLDIANGFNTFNVAAANGTNTTLSITYLMGNVPRFAGGYNSFMNPLAD